METNASLDAIFDGQSLPCGRKIANRLVKVALYEHLASIFGGPPNDYHFALYSAWSEHNWGMIITGNVIVSPHHLTLGRDMVVPPELTNRTIAPFEKLAKTIHAKSSKCLAIMQLNHAGRQSSNFLGGRRPFVSPLGPSSLRFGNSKQKSQGIFSDLFHRLLFQTPVAMSLSDIEAVISDFVRGALLASRSGFDGVQLHAAHGCKYHLLAQFLSPKANIRTDEYSPDSLLLLKRIVNDIRQAVPGDFILGIKFNTSDYSLSYEIEAKKYQDDRALAHLREIVSWKTIDFIEISGGDYENPEFMLSASSMTSKNPRQAFFADFSSKLMKELELSPSGTTTQPLILLTGGLCTPAHLYAALAAKHAHLLGLGRSSVLAPNLPSILKDRIQRQKDNYTDVLEDLTSFSPEPDLSVSFTKRWPWNRLWEYVPKVTLIGAGTGIAWYALMMRRLAQERINSRSRGHGIGMNAAAEAQGQELGDTYNARCSFSPDYSIGGLGAVLGMWLWVDAPKLPNSREILLFSTIFAIMIVISISMIS
ncbi:hypothetical protein GYMLUDRAFT_154143 [Collybiopsis luxurians FD-317 M1]|nr:hypothetical protein GYMLUDRAFT_154143 [Collybiopsis luxurians FD-317 M1]